MADARRMTQGLCRGTTRLLAQQGFAALSEVRLANGRRADIVALGGGGEIRIVEIKSSPGDFRADRKWRHYRDWCDRLYFAVAADFDAAVLPADCGLIRADAWGAAVAQEAPWRPLAPARRRALVLRFALLAGHRLNRCLDPELDAAVALPL